MRLIRGFHVSARALKTIALCPGQGNVGPALFNLIQHEVKCAPELVLETIERVRPYVEDPRIFGFFDPEKSPFMVKGHPNMALLQSTRTVQPLVLLATFLNYQLVEKYTEWDIRTADYLLGHSLGELTGFVVQDVLSLDAGMRIAATRGRLMDDVVRETGKQWGMCALLFSPADFKVILNICQSKLGLNVATINGFNQIVVSGEKAHLVSNLEKLDQIRATLKPLGQWKGPLRKVWLQTEVPVHHPIFQSIEQELRDTIMNEYVQCGNKELRVPIVSNLDGAIVSVNAERALEKFVKLTSSTVKFTQCLETLYRVQEEQENAQLNFVNVSEVTSGIVQRYYKDAGVKIHNYNVVAETLAGLNSTN